MRVLIFSGTSEGRALASLLSDDHIETCVSVATEYGEMVMDEVLLPHVTVRTGRLNAFQMEELIRDFSLVVDATHPYAVDVTKNIIEACGRVGKEYIRLLRADTSDPGDAYDMTAGSVREAAEYLARHASGRIFVSTGSKELHEYAVIPDYRKRLIARVLPVDEARYKCEKLGIRHAIFELGPFSYEQNFEAFKTYGVDWLVTKSAGKIGGFEEKIRAARDLGMKILVIRRPNENEDGYSMEEVRSMILERAEKEDAYPRFPLFISLAGKRVVVIGAGEIGCRRIRTLLKYGAEVTVISPDTADPELMGSVKWEQREYADGDCRNACLVVASTNKRDVNHRIYEYCASHHILVSTADCREESSFYFPAVYTDEKTSIGIVGDGKDHGHVKRTSARIREMMEKEI